MPPLLRALQRTIDFEKEVIERWSAAAPPSENFFEDDAVSLSLSLSC
jgi:hypothetical protein